MSSKNKRVYVGVDEVGRGPLAGPVTVGVFCVPQKTLKQVHMKLAGITDSKKLTESKREAFVHQINDLANKNMLNYTTSSVSAKLIDRNGIIWAVNMAIKRALDHLNVDPQTATIALDGGLKAPLKFTHQETIIKGDSKNWLIGAASVIAKVHRDRKMVHFSKQFPQYGFHKHKGYGTRMHQKAIKEYGLTYLHRALWIHGTTDSF